MARGSNTRNNTGEIVNLSTYVLFDGLLDFCAGFAHFSTGLVHGRVQEVAEGLGAGYCLGGHCRRYLTVTVRFHVIMDRERTFATSIMKHGLWEHNIQ